MIRETTQLAQRNGEAWANHLAGMSRYLDKQADIAQRRAAAQYSPSESTMDAPL